MTSFNHARLVLGSLFICACVIVPAHAASVYWDVSNGVADDYRPSGRYAPLVQHLQPLGFTFTEGTVPLDQAPLDQFDVLVIANGSTSNGTYAPAELQRIDDFVRAQGRALLLMSDVFGSSGSAATRQVAQIFGADVSTQQFPVDDVFSTDVHPHPATIGVDSVYLRFSSPIFAGPAMEPVAARFGDLMATAGTPGAGRVVHIADGDLFTRAPGPITYFDRADNRQFATSTFQFLLPEPAASLTGVTLIATVLAGRHARRVRSRRRPDVPPTRSRCRADTSARLRRWSERSTTPFLALIALLTLSGTCVAGAAAVFMPLGDLHPGTPNSTGFSVSADGRAVSGVASRADGFAEPFLWTADTGMTGLGYLPGGSQYGWGYAVSNGGASVVGTTRSAQSAFSAFRWTPASGMVGLGNFPGAPPASHSNALGVSADGSVIVGAAATAHGTEAFRWTPAGGLVGLGMLPGHDFSAAYDVSPDGRFIVGRSNSFDGTIEHAVLWSPGGGIQGLGDLPGGATRGEAHGVSRDGSIVVGFSASAPSGLEAFRWTAATGMVGLGELPGGDAYSVAWDVSGDGTFAVGDSRGEENLLRAFIWDEAHGMRVLRDVLQNDYGINLQGWELVTARGISDDGLTITGSGRPPGGGTEAWIVHLPEPTGVVAALVLVGGPCARRRSVCRRS